MLKFTHRVTQTFDTLAASYPFSYTSAHWKILHTTLQYGKLTFFWIFFQVLNTGGQLTLRAAPQPPQQQQTPQQQQPNNRIMTQQQQQYDQYQQQQQQQQNPVYQQPHQHHSANELYDMYDEYATGKRCSFLRPQCGNFMIFLSLRFLWKINFEDFRRAKSAILNTKHN